MNSSTMIFRLIIFILFIVLLDFYAFQAFKTVFKDNGIVKWAYWIISIGLIGFILLTALNFDRGERPNQLIQIIIGVSILLIIPKILLIVFMFGEDLVRLSVGIFHKISGNGQDEFLASRRKFVSQGALTIAAIPFIGIIHGMWKGKYNYKVIQKTLSFKDLPDAFDGLTITQISDIHSGSFDNPEKVAYGVDLINEQNSDLILFTGDLVNNTADEMDPWLETFGKLKAPMGKYSILGNHDYGDYVRWDSKEDQQKNMEKLFQTHKDIGFQLLRNENVEIQKDGQKIDLIGVENWGDSFVKHGDLKKATENLDFESFKILMSHDPSHFDKQVKQFGKFIHLTLSGHTHGMQFGIEIPGWIKFSPVKFKYPKWAGLYEEMGRYLYVNRGFGYLAFPGRVGIWPEITVLKLSKSKD